MFDDAHNATLPEPTLCLEIASLERPFHLPSVAIQLDNKDRILLFREERSQIPLKGEEDASPMIH